MATIDSSADALKALSNKITSEEQYDAIAGLDRWIRDYVGCSSDRPAMYDTDGTRRTEPTWWFRRERARLYTGYYETTDVLTQLDSQYTYQYAVHISRDDNTMIAYTPTIEAGESDKQIRTTLGKFLRKHFLLLSDKAIQDNEAAHRAEISGEILFATTRADIIRVYTNMAGDSGCMRHTGEKWGMPSDMHPSAVYEAPGMAVAYTEINGVIKSRSVVWVNPDDEKDKRYVRLYGDAKLLKRKLEAQGYRCDGLQGARLARIPHPNRTYADYYDRFVMPYLDGPGGAQNDRRGCYVRLDDDDRYITVISDSVAGRLTRMPGGDFFATQAKNYDSACVRLHKGPSMSVKCAISGRTYNSMMEDTVKVLMADGTVQDASAAAYDAETARCGSSVYRVQHVEKREDGTYHASNVLLLRSDAPVKDSVLSYGPTFYASYSTYVDTPVARAYCGHAKLDARYYPDNCTEFKENAVEVYVPSAPDTAGVYALRTDTVDLVVEQKNEAGEVQALEYIVHTSELPALRKMGYVNASPVSTNRKTLLMPSAQDTGRSVGGTYFSKQHCRGRFVKLYDGRWELSTKTQRQHVLGIGVLCLRSDSPQVGAMLTAVLPTSPLGRRLAAYRKDALESSSAAVARDALTSAERTLHRNVESSLGTLYYRTPDGGYAEPVTRVATWDQQRAAIASVKAAPSLVERCAHEISVMDALVALVQPDLDAMREHIDALALVEEAAVEEARRVVAAAVAAQEATRSALQMDIDALLADL